mgnify:CR=1 FL=1
MVVYIKVHYIPKFFFKPAEQTFIRHVNRHNGCVIAGNMVGLPCKIVILFGYNIGADNARRLAYFFKRIVKRVGRAERIAVGRGMGQNNIIIMLMQIFPMCLLEKVLARIPSLQP